MVEKLKARIKVIFRWAVVELALTFVAFIYLGGVDKYNGRALGSWCAVIVGCYACFVWDVLNMFSLKDKIYRLENGPILYPKEKK